MRTPAPLSAVVAAVLLSGPMARALPPEDQERVVAAARALLDTPYQLGGRLKRDQGIDCQGLVFFALQPVASCGWKSWSVFPTTSLPGGELGAPVGEGAPVATAELDVEHLEPGDVLWLVGFDENPAESAIGTLDGKPVWVWHVGVASEAGRFIHADVFAGKVIEVDVRAYLTEHKDWVAGAIVTRMDKGPKPVGRCRHHPPMTPRVTP